jgi:hypothetical protein
MGINEEYLEESERFINDSVEIKLQAEKLKANMLDYKSSTGIYMKYIVELKLLRNSLLNETVESLKAKLKALGLADEELKKLDKKIDFVNKAIEML